MPKCLGSARGRGASVFENRATAPENRYLLLPGEDCDEVFKRQRVVRDDYGVAGCATRGLRRTAPAFPPAGDWLGRS